MIYLIIILAIATRFVPHMSNAVPITALAIFAAANLPKKQAVGMTMAARLVSDIFLGFFGFWQMVAVYAAHLFGILLGLWIKKSPDNKWLKIGVSGFISALVFFLTTNFAFLYSEYPHTWGGIISAYTNGLPFFRGTLIGDVGYTVALFGVYELVKYFVANRKEQLVKNSLA